MSILEKVNKSGLVLMAPWGQYSSAEGLATARPLNYGDHVLDNHKSYYAAGAYVACANTFGASPINLVTW